MTRNTLRTRRRGSVLPLVVLTLVSMCGFVALAIDLGLIAVAKTQCQNAADAGAMAGARSLNGSAGVGNAAQNLGDVNTNGSSMWYALTTAQANKVLTDTIPAANVTLTYGAWHYDATSQLFTPEFPPVAPDNYNLVQVDVSYAVQTNFAGVFKYLNPNFNSLVTVQAESQAAHRPRDVAMILDYSGSMNNESDLWNCEPYLDNGSIASTLNGYKFPADGNPAWTSNNTDPVYPQFGAYIGTSSTAHSTSGNDYGDYLSNPNLMCPAGVSGNTLNGNNMIGKANTMHDLTVAQGVAAMVVDFYQNSRGSTATAAFTSAGNGNATTHLVAGDAPLLKNGSATVYAQNVSDIVGGTAYNSSWEANGYNSSGVAGHHLFNGYTEGPGYWGKTFFLWPPDPSPASTAAQPTVMKAISATSGAKVPGGTITNGTNDWRQNFFYNATGSAPLTDNTKLFQDGSGNNGNNGIGYNDPAGNYVINYKAILNWIKNCGPNPLPTQLRSGNVQIYGSIPSDVGGSPVGPTGPYDHTQPNSNIANADQRFWKEYIDWTLGVWRDPTGNIQHTFTSTCSVGPDFRYSSTGAIVASGATKTIQLNAAPATGHVPPAYMNYLDNPWRPRHRLWFGPGTMIQFMMDCGYLPGTTHDVSMFPMKQGVGGALADIQNNHPNDLIAMLLFSRPVYGNDPAGIGRFNVPQYSLTNDYTSMLTSLWVPPGSGSLGSDVKLFGDANAVMIPSAHADFDANTASSFGFMQAYNQYSGNRGALVNQTGMGGTGSVTVGGLGRKGATKLVIYETDGMANEDSTPQSGPTNSGAYNSYYNIRPSDTVNGNGYSETNLLKVVEAICNRDDGTAVSVPNGYPTPPSLPGYATVNRPVIVQCIAFGAIFESSSSTQTSSVALLQKISTIGGTVFPNSSTDPANGFKWCTGTLQQRQDKLKQAFLNFLDSSVPVSLIE